MWATAFGQAFGSIVGPAADVTKETCRYVKRKYDYVKNLDKNFELLREENNSLCAEERYINLTIEQDEVSKMKTPQCERWLEKITTIKDERRRLEARYERAKSNKWLCGLCPFSLLLKLGRDVVRKTDDIKELIATINHECIVMERPLEPVVQMYPRHIDGLQSLSEHVIKLVEYLEDKNVKRIGILGMSGVGKTTIMENLNEEVRRRHDLFDLVILVTVPKGDTDRVISEIQQSILVRLGLKEGRSNGTTVDKAATLISEALGGKKYLLLLDDVFSKIDLRRVGIHIEQPHGHPRGKLVIAARNRSICDSMEVEEYVRVEGLSPREALQMFRKIVGDVADYRPIKAKAELVVKECGGLPLVIKAVGTILKNNSDEAFWLGVLWKLRSSTAYELRGLDEVFNAFKLAFDELENKQKNCLLCGTLFPEDHEICQEYLKEFWIAAQFVSDVTTFADARDGGHYILEGLIGATLLKRCNSSKKYVKMPSLFRDMALRIIADQRLLGETGQGILKHVLVKAGKGISMEGWREAEMISLMCNNMRTLPADEPECCATLSALLLQRNESLSEIPHHFFNSMSCLRVLDLCHTGIESLPPSISNLVNLRGLYLNDCPRLVGLPTGIAELKMLEIFDIRRIGIRCLPIEIGELHSLKCLRLSFENGARFQNHAGTHSPVISPNTLQQLESLEELTIYIEPSQRGWGEIVDEIVMEVARLTSLTTLCFHFPNETLLATFITKSKQWIKFRAFKFLVGSSHQLARPRDELDISGDSVRRQLRFSGGGGNGSTSGKVAEVLECASAIELIGHDNVENLSDFSNDGMGGLRVCVVEKCKEMKGIAGGNMAMVDAFPCLEALHIINLERLQFIWDGPIGQNSFARLTTLNLTTCPEMTRIFSWEMTQKLSKLHCLSVEDCKKVATIVEDAGQRHDDRSRALPGLKVMKLVRLPSLVSICADDQLGWPSLEEINIRECSELKNLSLTMENARQLNSIHCDRHWWDGLVFQGGVREHLQRHCSFF